MAKLFADRLQILETKLNEIHSTESIDERLTQTESRLKQVEQKVEALATKLEQCDAKITQIINEITPIITSHANALNALLGNSHIANTK